MGRCKIELRTFRHVVLEWLFVLVLVASTVYVRRVSVGDEKRCDSRGNHRTLVVSRAPWGSLRRRSLDFDFLELRDDHGGQAVALAGVVTVGPWGLTSLSVLAALAGTLLIFLLASRENLTPARRAIGGQSQEHPFCGFGLCRDTCRRGSCISRRGRIRGPSHPSRRKALDGQRRSDRHGRIRPNGSIGGPLFGPSVEAGIHAFRDSGWPRNHGAGRASHDMGG